MPPCEQRAGFDRATSSDIRRSNNVQLEMVIANFFHCENIVMEKMFFLVKQADEALLDLQLILDDQDLFGSMRGVVLSDCEEELDKVFGETNTERNDELLR